MSSKLPDSLHFVGIGGIGMSGLAQMARALGLRVSGSDRALNKPENALIFNALRSQGIDLFSQDGSRFSNPADLPGALVYSTAIEEDNPDFKAAGSLPRLHRSRALEAEVAMLQCEHTIAVTGSCGKTSVSSWLAETLCHLDADAGFLTGGLVNAFRSGNAAGNFRHGTGKYFVLEADESDKSLLNYTADSAMVLNIGTDHYSKEEVARVFGKFLSSIRDFAVVELEAYCAICEHFGKLPASLKVLLFSGNRDVPEEFDGHPVFRLMNYRSGADGTFARFSGAERPVCLPGPGRHQALNALALYAELLELGFSENKLLQAMEGFQGVWRRFDPAGVNGNGVRFFDDYAHNVEKIISCIHAGREIASGRLILFFQPHGFGPLNFMRSELLPALEKHLDTEDIFAMLPVYYAGGTSSFTPTSEDVIREYQQKGTRRYLSLPDRTAALNLVRNEAHTGDLVLVMGARDNSLSAWTKELAAQSDDKGSI